VTGTPEVLSFSDQVETAIRLVQTGRIALAAATVGGFTRVSVEHPTPDVYAMPLGEYVACVLIELERGHDRNALVALESIRSIYCGSPSLRLIDGGAP